MKVGLISDTHDNQGMISKAVDFFKNRDVNAVIHAGDWVAPFSAKKFECFSGRIYGVYGNNDGEILGLNSIFQDINAQVGLEFADFDIEGEKIAVTHGTSTPTVEAILESGRFPFLVHGHTHEPSVRDTGDTLAVNPGEACGYLSGRATVALLDTGRREAIIHDLS